MPMKSTVYIYGKLDNKPVTLDLWHLHITQKTIAYFTLLDFMTTISEEKKKEVFGEIITDILTGGGIFETKVHQILPLEKYEEAIESSIVHSTLGKTVFGPQLEE
eukprot:CAMPEP_0205834618 /NCGR_PEP_ID=MMETSP0206-20130828/50883_1 /ASSEMBLY_ACC=CAM_ASM_000279 /TAXON_ID=36767 /ORGANISM="Euplotes focardii, Strain TN1" /LENGTH=104 /DNA_ID=CAMNT_0053141691 /DNA_START=521 /DNA_END=835 /DNA_ORIENTATION=-